MRRDFEEAHLLAETQRQRDEALGRVEMLIRLYARLRHKLEAYGPVEPIKSILDEHMNMLEGCGYDDPLVRKRPLVGTLCQTK